MEKRKDSGTDCFYAVLEAGELIMEPHCACGTYLSEEYFCEKCNRQCMCTEIRCKNNETLAYVTQFIKDSEQFKKFSVVLDEEQKERNE